jgi:hypothetical protein
MMHGKGLASVPIDMALKKQSVVAKSVLGVFSAGKTASRP